MRFFTVPVRDSGPVQAELNQFLAEHVVLNVEQSIISDGAGAAWAVCVRYLAPSEAGKETSSPKKGRVDYREILSESDFAVYAQLRDLRKRIAEEKGAPPYTLFTNEQLAAMVTQRVTSKEALEALDGVGEARVEKYSVPFLRVLARAFGGGDA